MDVNPHGGMKALSTRAGMERYLGKSYGDLSPTERRMFDSAVGAAKNGNVMELNSTLSPFLKADGGRMRLSTRATLRVLGLIRARPI
jgi:hypothetical protein